EDQTARRGGGVQDRRLLRPGRGGPPAAPSFLGPPPVRRDRVADGARPPRAADPAVGRGEDPPHARTELHRLPPLRGLGPGSRTGLRLAAGQPPRPVAAPGRRAAVVAHGAPGFPAVDGRVTWPSK